MYSTKKAHIHFVGIGGIGMSGIATILRYQGFEISGCDLDVEQKSVKDLCALGCQVFHGNNTPACQTAPIDILVYSSALKVDNPEILAAQSKGIPTIARADMLAELMRTKYSIAISGAHGKTTTTSMISHILIEAGWDPTVIIGGHLTNLSTNARLGKGDFLVAEADESDRSFLRLHPALAVVTNIDLEHLDVYKDLDDIKATFVQFLKNLPFYGKAFVCSDDANIQALGHLPQVKFVRYGTTDDADICAKDIVLGAKYSTCTIWKKGALEPLGSLYLTMPGRHNILNATAAVAVALDLGIPFATIMAALASFKGVDRRFTYKGICQGAELFDDYAHHPNEIKQALAVARKRAQGKLIVAFQPHRYSRTQGLWNEFIEVFRQGQVDRLIITDIYPASEAPIPGVTGQSLTQAISQAIPNLSIVYVPFEEHFTSLTSEVQAVAQPKDLVLLLGAGKMNKLADKLKN